MVECSVIAWEGRKEGEIYSDTTKGALECVRCLCVCGCERGVMIVLSTMVERASSSSNVAIDA